MGAALLLGAIFLLAALSGSDNEQSAESDAPPLPKPPKEPKKEAPSAALVKHAAGFKKAVAAFQKEHAAELAEAKAIEESPGTTGSKEANTYAAALGVAAAAAQSIPVVGNLVGVLLGALAALVRYLPQGAWLPRIEAKDFTGWRDDSYWYHDIPIFAPVASKMLDGMPHPYLGDDSQSYKGLLALIEHFPTGPAVPVVSVRGQGGADSYFEFEYSFNFTAPGDVSKESRDRGEVRTMTVWEPADVTPTGPRGFDPADPWGWKQPGERRNKIVTVRPGELLI